jgi:hypothetical protein
MARELADLLRVPYPVHSLLAAFDHYGAANRHLLLSAITGPRPESLQVYCKGMTKLR